MRRTGLFLLLFAAYCGWPIAAFAATTHPIGKVSPTNLKFGSVLVNVTSQQLTTTLTNTGTADLVVSNVSTTGPFSVAVNGCSMLAPKATCQVSVTYAPMIAETDDGELYLTSNAKNSPQKVSLTGTGEGFKVLYKFNGSTSDGASPNGGLVMDSQGNVFGTTVSGGLSSPNCYQGCGTVFKLTPNGTETVLYTFSGPPTDGAEPQGGLLMDAQGNLYGATSIGGSGGSLNCGHGCGTIFKLTPSGTETVLYSFNGLPTDGFGPISGLVMDAAGNIYGATGEGGNPNCGFYVTNYGCGTVFKLTPSGSETILHIFNGPPSDGEYPSGGLVMDAQGNLYGMTLGGGSSNCTQFGYNYGCGMVFKLTPGGTETVLYNFNGYPNDGSWPEAAPLMDAQGNLYGVTGQGGSFLSGFCGFGCGTVFELSPGGSETVLYNFCSQANCADGGQPQGGLIIDVAGNLYGSTYSLFKLAPNGTETVLHSFCADYAKTKEHLYCFDGVLPSGNLVMGADGNIYGATSEGGHYAACPQELDVHSGAGCGTIFAVAP